MILIVENDDIQRLATKMLLEGEGHTIIAVSNVPEASRVMERVLPSIVLLDMIMPGQCGSALLDTIHNDSKYKDVKVIVTSAMPSIAGDVRLAIPQVSYVLTKPFTAEMLIDTVKKVVSVKK